jgi:hypothetical protein
LNGLDDHARELPLSQDRLLLHRTLLSVECAWKLGRR